MTLNSQNAQYVNFGGIDNVTYVDSIADLRLSKPSVNGEVVVTSGASYIGDGLGSMYVWSDTETRADNGSTIIASQYSGQSGRWLIINDGNSFIFDYDILAYYGAKMDGVTDDGPVFNKIIKTVTNLAIADGRSSITFNLPPRNILIGTPIVTTGVNVSFMGMGSYNSILNMAVGGTGVIIHGTETSQTNSYLQIENVMIVDNGGIGSQGPSGATAVTGYWSGGTVPTIRMTNVRIRGFKQGLNFVNPPRDMNFINLTVYGPDYKVQPVPAIEIDSTQNGQEVFTTTWLNCNVFNYTIGWRFIGAGMMEGHRFNACTCYNGWAMVQAYVHGDGIVGLTGYQAVIWDFYACDWQGWGYAFDMHNCRGVRITNGFYTFNDRKDSSGNIQTDNGQLYLDAPWGARTSAATNAMMSFVDCADVMITGVQMDTSASGQIGDTVLAYFDNDTHNVLVRDNAIFANSTMYGGFELGLPSTVNPTSNTQIIGINRWLNWIGGDKVIDHGSNQVDTPWINDNYLGSVTENGFYNIQQQSVQTIGTATVGTATVGQVTVTFPKRRYGQNIFNGGVPTVVANVQQALEGTFVPWYLGYTDRSELQINFDKTLIGTQVTINYIVQGW